MLQRKLTNQNKTWIQLLVSGAANEDSLCLCYFLEQMFISPAVCQQNNFSIFSHDYSFFIQKYKYKSNTKQQSPATSCYTKKTNKKKKRFLIHSSTCLIQYGFTLDALPDTSPKGTCISSWKQTSNLSLAKQMCYPLDHKLSHQKVAKKG